jgi:hypothetical protein
MALSTAFLDLMIRSSGSSLGNPRVTFPPEDENSTKIDAVESGVKVMVFMG